MKAISSKINIYIKSVGVINDNIEKFIFNIILWSFGILAFFYILFLGNMVRNIVDRQNLEQQARVLTNEVRNLEVTYLSMSNTVDLPLSYSMGFKNIQAIFATRRALGFNSGVRPADSIKIVQNDL